MVPRMQHGSNLVDIDRCPRCGIANPYLSMVWQMVAEDVEAKRQGVSAQRRWAVYQCSVCNEFAIAKGSYGGGDEVAELLPSVAGPHADLPERAARYLQQAYETLHSPDAAAVMAASAVDAMLKAKKYSSGSLYNRIDKAVADHVLTDAMGEWAHAVRLESNKPRHADENDPHVSSEEAKQVVEFCEALGQFLFVLPARIKRGLSSASGNAGK